MMKVFFLLIFFFNMVFVFSFHPLGMIFILIAQTILISMMIFSLCNFPWFSYTLILVFLGGMLVLFTYMANIASNEKFSPKFSPYNLLLFSVPMFLILPGMVDTPGSNLKTATEESLLGLSAVKIFESTLLPLVSLMAALIILTLLAVVKVSKVDKGPIRIE
uniref:NADH dehydrogenase subunit 6 n=1 Tax=Octolasmis warwickii TaxID=479288 RepID=UPI0021CCF934|nr:NADH dehydrogenase subunit 6 [Octolasmis warwickii]UWM12944.1 NADH dehydrogenase subunit 6 [Octolasmis warwickii]